jgi:hypothetical protein
MLTRLIVATYSWLLETVLGLLLVLAGVAGYHVAIPIMSAAGAVPEYEIAWKLLGAFAFPVISFLVMAAFFGPFLILMDVRQAVRSIEARLNRGEDTRESPTFERREPTI